jgi:hypothetical protein
MYFSAIKYFSEGFKNFYPSLSSEYDVQINTMEKTTLINKSAEVCIPGGEKTNPEARKSSVTAQTVGTAYNALDQNARKRSRQLSDPSSRVSHLREFGLCTVVI